MENGIFAEMPNNRQEITSSKTRSIDLAVATTVEVEEVHLQSHTCTYVA